MTSNAIPPPAGRRRTLGRGPGVPRAEPPAGPAAEPAGAVSAEAESAGPPTEPSELTEPRGATEPAEALEPVGSGVSPVEAVAGSAVVEDEAVGPAAGPRREGDFTVAESAPGGAAAEHESAAAPDGETLAFGPVAEQVTAVPDVEAGTPEDRSEAAGDGAQSPADAGGADDGVFKVRLANFEGPFDLLLQLISKHKLDVTEVALSKVTDEFMAYIRAMGPDWDLDETTEFLVVAATLLDLKAARLLPAAEVEDEADLALLEARDLLFARLLQYRAYKQIADIFNGRLDDEARRYPRTVGLEPQHAELLPEVVISIGAEGFAKLAVKAMQPKPKPQVYVDHIHAPLVSVQEQAGIVIARLKELGEASFRALVEDTDDTLTVVARFLALLELYREKAVALEQEAALGELLVRWTGGDGDETPTVTDEFDRPPEPPKEEKKA
ncbi:segregation/condensation protein A [Streptomyces tuirus]|uniref:Segregation and condensation protein A n=1 Tax=Streptomyces tuirus TaxID=68278 RepID=A0A941FIH3_9ACTN|nr:segregation/condensation protein A [Streptomyces tuirus]